MKTKLLGLVFLSLILIFSGCVPEAPHLNPIDPYVNLQSEEKLFTGDVLKKNDPHLPIEGSLVLMLPERQFDVTDKNGRFSFSLLSNEVHQFIISKAGFTTDTFTVDPDTVQESLVHFFLNGNPRVKSVRIFSEYIDQWWPDPITFVNFQMTADDPDGVSDIQSLRIRLPDLGIDTTFQATAQPDSFVLRLSDRDFPDNDPFQLIGKDIFVVLVDKSGIEISDGPFYLVRIMENSPVPIEPVGLRSVEPQPVFRWQPYPASFAFTYEISVFVVQGGIPILIFGDGQIPMTQSDYQYPDSLATGTYFWTIGVRDELGNFSRSKEASFVVP